MDGDRFDGIARRMADRTGRRQAGRLLAGGVSRRRVLRTLAGGVAAAALAMRGGAASAEPERRPCRAAGKQCGRGNVEAERCCSGLCCDRACCGEGEACTGHGCCPPTRACGDICCPPESTGCTAPDLPDGTVVGCLCPEGTLYKRETNECRPCQGFGGVCSTNDDCCADSCCQGACRDYGTDEENCGSCGNVCPAGTFCSSGQCRCTTPGQTNCNGVCTDLQADAQHCGFCGNLCPAGMTCSRGECTCSTPGLTNCSGVCRNLQTEEEHCGACNTLCPPGANCVSGACECTGFSLYCPGGDICVDCGGRAQGLRDDCTCCSTGGGPCGSAADCCSPLVCTGATSPPSCVYL